MNKYRNAKTTHAGITFDSKKESERYAELMLLLRAGAIENLKLQPEFTLQEAFTTIDGERIRAIKYRADFMYSRLTEPDCNGEQYRITVVEDVKGIRTKDYLIKKKLMADKFGIHVVEI